MTNRAWQESDFSVDTCLRSFRHGNGSGVNATDPAESSHDSKVVQLTNSVDFLASPAAKKAG